MFFFITDDTTTADDEPHFMYYVNDGVYGSFNCLLYDHAEVYPELLEVRQSWSFDGVCDSVRCAHGCFPVENQREKQKMVLLFSFSLILQSREGDGNYSSSIWGPTCDGLDCIKEQINMPELDTGDWIIFRDMGAYTMCAASSFNGMPMAKRYYASDESYL